MLPPHASRHPFPSSRSDGRKSHCEQGIVGRRRGDEIHVIDCIFVVGFGIGNHGSRRVPSLPVPAVVGTATRRGNPPSTFKTPFILFKLFFGLAILAPTAFAQSIGVPPPKADQSLAHPFSFVEHTRSRFHILHRRIFDRSVINVIFNSILQAAFRFLVSPKSIMPLSVTIKTLECLLPEAFPAIQAKNRSRKVISGFLPFQQISKIRNTNW